MGFESERLVYRGISAGDAETIVAWRSDPENYRFFFNNRPITLEGHLEWFVRYLDDETRYDFIIMNREGLPIGTCGISSIGNDSCEISYMIGDKASRGSGFAKEAVRRLSRLAFEELCVSHVVARVLPSNEASARVLQAEGFVESERVFRLENR